MALDLTAYWTQRAALRDKKVREQLETDSRRVRHEEKAQERESGDLAMSAAEILLAVQQQQIREMTERLERLDRVSLEALRDAEDRLEQIRTS